jgi:P-type Cu2+ transporter
LNQSTPPCFHCGAAIPKGVLVEEKGPDATLSFCCRGCHGAYLLISGAGLSDFYLRRDWQEPGVAEDSFQNNFTDSYLARFVQPAVWQGSLKSPLPRRGRAGEGEIGPREIVAGDIGEEEITVAASAIDLIIEGIRCASCVWLNEKIIGGLPGVLEARVNYATGRARVLFDPEFLTPAAILSRVAEIGYRARPYTSSAAREGAKREQRDLLLRFGTAVFLTMQLMAYSFALYAGYFQGIDPQIKGYLQIFSCLVTTPVIFYCGWPFLAGAWRSLVNRSPNMELLIAVGALSSYGYSVYASLAGGEVYFETAAMIVTLILAGRLLENAAKRRSAGGIEQLLGLCGGESQRFCGDTLETVDTAQLAVGDLILVGPGERFPTDGRVVEGASDVDQSPATGEAVPVLKLAGDPVIAGSCNLTGALRVVCEKIAAESFIARVAHLVEEAQSRRAPIQRLADRAAGYFVPAVLVLALATFCWRYVGSGGAFAVSLMTALAVVVIACPCALGLATPTAILAGTGAAATNGVIFKGGDILERLSRVSLAVFDKTGTLTCGFPEVTEIRPVPGVSPQTMLELAASVESGSLHPIGRAIREHATAAGMTFPTGFELQAVPGGGVSGTISGERIAVGSERFLRGLGTRGMPDSIESPAGALVVLVARAGSYLGALLLKDRMRDEAPELVAYFRKAGIGTLLLSGDRQEAAGQAALRLGIDEGIGDLLPAQKAGYLEELRRGGAIVLMVGDGINDAPALAAADIGCAVSGGTDIAIETSDLVLVRPDLARLSEAHRMARRTMGVVRQNLIWAFLYNVVGIPLAMTGRLTPIYAAGAMALSSVCVVGNSLRLLRYKRG